MLANNSVESEDGPAPAQPARTTSATRTEQGDEDEPPQAKLTTTQRATISLVAPQLLNNVPHPWCVFLFLVSLNVAAFSGLVWFVYVENCPTTDTGMSMITYSQWKTILSSDSFNCLRVTGAFRYGNVGQINRMGGNPAQWTGTHISGAVRKSDGTEPGDLKGPGRVTRSLAVGQRLYLDLPHFVPCIPGPTLHFMQMYHNITGDLKAERLWCHGWSPEDLGPRFPNIEECAAVSGSGETDTKEGVHTGTFLHELFLFPIIYEQKNCPKLISALGVALSVVMYISIGLLIAVIACCALSGMAKPLRRVDSPRDHWERGNPEPGFPDSFLYMYSFGPHAS